MFFHDTKMVAKEAGNRGLGARGVTKTSVNVVGGLLGVRSGHLIGQASTIRNRDAVFVFFYRS